MTLHICTSGTSIARGPAEDSDLADYRRRIDARLAQLRTDCGGHDFYKQASAELNCLHRLDLQGDDRVVLLCTDTGDGEMCAEAVASVLKTDFTIEAELRRIGGLQVHDAKRFAREGIPSLFETLNAIGGPSVRYGAVRLNVTGGFKSVVPYLTLYGLIHRLPVDYLFERSDTPLSLPPAPVNFDYNLLQYAERALRKLNAEGSMPSDQFWELIDNLEYDQRMLFECLIEHDGDYVTASGFAELLLQSDAVEATSIYLSPSARNTFENADADGQRELMKLLHKCRSPLWRSRHFHNFNGTDLAAFKPGDVQARMGAILRPARIYVCELYVSHDFYERDLNGRNAKDYELNQFTAWSEPDGDTSEDAELPEEAERRRHQEEIARLTHQCQQLTEQVEARDRKLETERADHNAKMARAEQERQALRDECETLRDEREALQKQVDEMQNPEAGT